MALLTGIRVVELGTAITAPLPGMMLADLGAEVIKVEPPEGDFFRSGGGPVSPTFLAYNRGKRSVTLDLKSDAGRTAMLKLLADADVLVDNYRPGVLARLGLDPAMLRTRFPRLVHCSVTGFGTTGPYRDRPAFDSVGQALSGIAASIVDPARPGLVGPTIADNASGMYACTAILAALVERDRTGAGRRLELNMLECAMAFMPDAFTNYSATGVVPDRFSRVTRSQCYCFRCRDGGLIVVHLSTREKLWHALLEAAGATGLTADPRAASYAERVRHHAALQDALAVHFATRDRDDWLARLGARDVPAAPVCTVGEALADPQVAALEAVMELPRPEGGSYKTIRFPLRVDGERPADPAPPPAAAGQDNGAVLAALEAAGRKDG